MLATTSDEEYDTPSGPLGGKAIAPNAAPTPVPSQTTAHMSSMVRILMWYARMVTEEESACVTTGMSGEPRCAGVQGSCKRASHLREIGKKDAESEGDE